MSIPGWLLSYEARDLDPWLNIHPRELTMVYIILLQAGGRNRPVSFQAVKQTKHLVSVFTQSLFMVQSRYTHNLHICCSDTPTNQPRPESVRKPQSGRRLRCATISNGAAQNSPDWQRPGRAE